MKLYININQQASIAAGHDAPNSSEIVEIPAASIPEAIRPLVAACYDPATGKLARAIGTAAADAMGMECVDIGCPVPLSENPSLTQPITDERVVGALIAWADQTRATLANAHAQWSRRRADWTAETLAILTERRTVTAHVGATNDHVAYQEIRANWPYANRDATVIASPEAQAWLAEIATTNAAALAAATAKRAADIAAADAKRAWTTQYLQKHAPADMLERHEAGVLPSAELLDLIESHAFELLGLAPYAPITDDEIRAACDQHPSYDCECDTMRRDGAEIGTYSADLWERAKAFRAALAAAALAAGSTTCKIYFEQGRTRHQAWEDGISRPYAEVTVIYGPYTFSRRFAV